MDKTTKPTLTLHESAEVMRANLISISEEKLGEALVAGRLPFGFGVPGCDERAKHATYVIFRHAFYKWLEENLGHEAIKP